MFIMETMERKQPRRRRSFTPEFKAEIVERCRAGDRTIGQVAKDFDLTETAVRAWVNQAETDAGERPGLTSDERAELARLRRENRSLREDVEVLKRATAFLRRRPGEGSSLHRGGKSRRPRHRPCVPPAEGLPCRLLPAP
jgi:transposase